MSGDRFVRYAHEVAEFLRTPEGEKWLRKHLDAIETAVRATEGMEKDIYRVARFINVYQEEMEKE